VKREFTLRFIHQFCWSSSWDFQRYWSYKRKSENQTRRRNSIW
jgi:hypothetical protein